MTSKIQFLSKILQSERVNFGLFWGQNVTFLDFLKVLQELFVVFLFFEEQRFNKKLSHVLCYLFVFVFFSVFVSLF